MYDNFDYVKEEQLESSLTKYKDVVFVIENDFKYINLNPKCEPQLGRRGLYRAVAGQQEKQWTELALFWVLNGSDGHHTLLDIAERADLPFGHIQSAAEALLEVGLLKECRRLGDT